MDPTEGSETSAKINQTLGIHPKVETVNTEHSESLKSRIFAMFLSVLLVAGRSDLSSSLTLTVPLRKTFHPLANCCFLHSIIPVNLH
jgi:hypothetical protein